MPVTAVFIDFTLKALIKIKSTLFFLLDSTKYHSHLISFTVNCKRFYVYSKINTPNIPFHSLFVKNQNSFLQFCQIISHEKTEN